MSTFRVSSKYALQLSCTQLSYTIFLSLSLSEKRFRTGQEMGVPPRKRRKRKIKRKRRRLCSGKISFVSTFRVSSKHALRLSRTQLSYTQLSYAYLYKYIHVYIHARTYGTKLLEQSRRSGARKGDKYPQKPRYKSFFIQGLFTREQSLHGTDIFFYASSQHKHQTISTISKR